MEVEAESAIVTLFKPSTIIVTRKDILPEIHKTSKAKKVVFVWAISVLVIDAIKET